MSTGLLSATQVEQLRSTAVVLIPGDGTSPAPTAIADFNELLQRAAAAVEPEVGALVAILDGLPDEPDRATLEDLATTDATRFELLSSVVAGAYFMSESVLESIGYPTGARAAFPFDLSAEELATGILDPVIDRGSRLRAIPSQSSPTDQIEQSKGRGNVE
ncbi:MAG: hypothetical protein JST59_21660 [Actinobacteria bacterium]|nr:hypothetical protein [Actinomycetota bacterium]